MAGGALGRAKLAKIKTLPRRETAARRQPAHTPEEPQGVAPLVNLLPGDVRALAKLLGDEQLARRVTKLAERFPAASLPELVVYEWLQRKGEQFTFQSEYGGGRTLRGGQVPDFVVSQGGRALVWRVQGEYWHTLPETREKDEVQRLKLMGNTLNGLRVAAVVDVWEQDIYQRREHTLRMALTGIGLRG